MCVYDCMGVLAPLIRWHYVYIWFCGTLFLFILYFNCLFCQMNIFACVKSPPPPHSPREGGVQTHPPCMRHTASTSLGGVCVTSLSGRTWNLSTKPEEVSFYGAMCNRIRELGLV